MSPSLCSSISRSVRPSVRPSVRTLHRLLALGLPHVSEDLSHNYVLLVSQAEGFRALKVLLRLVVAPRLRGASLRVELLSQAFLESSKQFFRPCAGAGLGPAHAEGRCVVGPSVSSLAS